MEKLSSLNGLRAISITMVILYHALHYMNLATINSNVFLRTAVYFFTDGQLGVNIFFVISGFLITSLLIGEKVKTGTISLKNFYIRRTLRIFPAYYFILLVYFVMQCAGFIQISGMSWLSAITYTKYFNWNLDWVTGHFWSLSIEEHFYLIWPFVFILTNEKARNIFLIIVICCVPLIRIGTYYHPISWINGLTIFTRIDSIAIGCLVALNRDKVLNVLSPYWNIAFILSITLLIILPIFSKALGVHGYIISGILIGGRFNTIADMLIAVIMLYSVFGPKNLWYKLLNSKLFDFVGLISYSLYLWQQLFFDIDDHLWISQLPQNIILLVGIAIGSYFIIEKPIIKLKSRFTS